MNREPVLADTKTARGGGGTSLAGLIAKVDGFGVKFSLPVSEWRSSPSFGVGFFSRLRSVRFSPGFGVGFSRLRSGVFLSISK